MIRPEAGSYFFCKCDASHLTRPYFLNLLDSCLLMTGAFSLQISPHSFQLSIPSIMILRGVAMTNILYHACWSPTRPELVDMHPFQIHQEYEQYQRPWTLNCLLYLARVMVESEGDMLHPFLMALKGNFSNYCNQLVQELPASFPHQAARVRLDHEIDSEFQGLYLSKLLSQCDKKYRFQCYHHKLSVAMHAMTKRRKASKEKFLFEEIVENVHSVTSVQTQTVVPPDTKCFQD